MAFLVFLFIPVLNDETARITQFNKYMFYRLHALTVIFLGRDLVLANSAAITGCILLYICWCDRPLYVMFSTCQWRDLDQESGGPSLCLENFCRQSATQRICHSLSANIHTKIYRTLLDFFTFEPKLHITDTPRILYSIFWNIIFRPWL